MTSYRGRIRLRSAHIQVFAHRKEYVNSYSMRHDSDNELLSDAVRMVFIELSKLDKILKKPVKAMTDLEKFALFFEYAPSQEHRKTVNKIIESEEALKVAGNLLMNISQNEKERAIFRSRRKFQSDLESDMATAEERGERKKAFEFAKKLLARNRPIDEIMEDTGLSLEEVESLK